MCALQGRRRLKIYTPSRISMDAESDDFEEVCSSSKGSCSAF